MEEKILIIVKTYPNFSKKYKELVCTAGIRTNGKFIRLYPINYRELSKIEKFKKYQWIKVKIANDNRDPRPESYKIQGNIKLLNFINTKNNWEERKKFVLNNIYLDLSKLIAEARNIKNYKSIAIFKPNKIIDFYFKKNLKIANDNNIDYIPYKFYYKFSDINGKISNLQILDWEIYQLYRKESIKYKDNKEKIEETMKEKYLYEFNNKKDLYLFLGTSRYWHIRRSKNPFMIIGVFYPPK